METPKQQVGIEQETKIPMALLEILVYGNESDREKMQPMLDSLQNQVNKHSHQARVLFYCFKDDNTLTKEEKQKTLIDLSLCRYYVFASEVFIIENTFVTKVLNKIKSHEKHYLAMRKAGIRYKPTPKTQNEEQKKEAETAMKVL